MFYDLSPEKRARVVEIVQWIIAAGNYGRSERGLTDGFSNRLAAAGVPVDRVSIGSDVLDPVLQSRSYIWRKGQGTEPYRYERTLRRSENWQKSTLFYMIDRGETRLRMRLDSPGIEEFSLLPQLRDEGFIDYYGRLEGYGERAGAAGTRGLMATFATKSANGFSDEERAVIDAVLPAFALAFLARLNHRILGRALTTYLGRTPAERVLRGAITRGESQTMEAVIWMSDLAGFTRTADSLPRESILEFLNAHAEVVTNAIEEHGGEVLKYIGDGILAVFPCTTSIGQSAGAALNAAIQVDREARQLKRDRRDMGRVGTDVIVALHRGEVLFGNFGSQDRLDFTALGPAVNESSRLCSLAKTLDQTTLVSNELRAALPDEDHRLVSVGRYALRGVSEPKHLYTLDREVQYG
jgi:adenylate cyclase